MRFNIAELLVLTALVSAGCVLPVLLVPLITFGLSTFLARRSRSLGISLAVVALCLYAPFAWLLMDNDWDDYRRSWMNLWPILPGFAVGALLFHPHDFLEFATMGLTTLALLFGLTWLGAAGRYRLVVAAALALAVSVPQAVMTYAVFRA